MAKNNEQKKELVNHPDHYNREIECIEEMRLVFGDEETAIFCKLNAWKYRYGRIGKPGADTDTDLKKSDWYMGYFQDLCELHQSNDEAEAADFFERLRHRREAKNAPGRKLEGTIFISGKPLEVKE